MRIRSFRAFALASLISAGLVGCNTENPDGTKNKLGAAEDKAKEVGHKIEEGAGKLEKKVEEGAVKAVDATGKALESGGKKLQEAVKDKKPE